MHGLATRCKQWKHQEFLTTYICVLQTSRVNTLYILFVLAALFLPIPQIVRYYVTKMCLCQHVNNEYCIYDIPCNQVHVIVGYSFVEVDIRI